MHKEVIGVHTGTFHLDDAMCCAMLKMLPQYADAEIFRSSNVSELEEKCTIICDVGGVYDHEKKRYDHHQKGFDERFCEDSEIKHAASGLIYRHYGKQILTEIAHKHGFTVLEEEPDDATKNDANADNGKCITPSQFEQCYKSVYWSVIAPIDAKDNGISQYPKDLKPLYKIETFLCDRVARLNPQWNEETNYDIAMERFKIAIKLAEQTFRGKADYMFNSSLPIIKLFKKAFDSRFEFHPSGSILRVNFPWTGALGALEEEAEEKGETITPTIYYGIAYDNMRDSYSVKAVSADIKNNSFELRLPFPESWRGLRDKELEDVCGVPGALFVHANGFIASNKTLEGAKMMAELSLKQLEGKEKEKEKETAKEQTENK